MKPRLTERPKGALSEANVRSERKSAAEFDPPAFLRKQEGGLTQNYGLSRPYGLHKSCLR